MKILLVLFVSVSALHAEIPQDSLPVQIVRILDSKFPGWQWGVVSDEVLMLFTDVYHKAYHSFISGDFNTDGKADYALKVTVKSAERDSDYVLAFLQQGSTYAFYILGRYQSSPDLYVLLSKKGEAVDDFDPQHPFILPSDAISLGFSENAQITFLYDKGKFESIITGD
jgi:hypothetical protein